MKTCRMKALNEHPNPRTIDYAALERATGVRKDDPRSDIYFVGAMFYHLLTGQAPFSDTKDRLQRLSVSRFEKIAPIEKIVCGCTNFGSQDRSQIDGNEA